MEMTAKYIKEIRVLKWIDAEVRQIK